MLNTHTPAINLAVKDLPTARRFYEEILGFAPTGTPNERLVSYRSGHTPLYVYLSEFAGTNKATAATWPVGAELDQIVATLQAKAVTFEHYPNIPNGVIKDGIHEFGPHRIAWFKDPDGNILSITNG